MVRAMERNWKSAAMVAAAVFTLATAGCGSDSLGLADAVPEPTGPGEGPWLAGDCDPLVPTACALPFPSNVWTVADATMPTRRHVEFGPTTLPGPTDPAPFRLSDGFSPGAGIMAHLPGATITGLPSPLTIARSLDGDSPTVLIEAETERRVVHFSELDQSHPNDDRRVLIVRPVVRLKPSTRYIVAIRGVVDAAGIPLAPSPVFRALRDGTQSDDPSVELRRRLYADIFAHLKKAGVGRDDLQLAWDFTVASDENNTRWALHMRDDALSQVGADGPTYRLDSVEPNPTADIAARIRGTMTVPLYLDKPGPGGNLVLGSDGMPQQNGTAEYGFLLIVPTSAAAGAPGAPLQIGHGLFGRRDQAEGFASFANQRSYVLIATDMVGMSSEDVPHVAGIITGKDMSKFKSVADRLDQGLLNALLAMRMVSGRLARDPAVQFGGQSAIKTDERYYLGGSQGGIFGASYMALSTDVTRGVLAVPGQPYNLLLNRSIDFDPYLAVMRTSFPDAIDLQIALGLTQMFWDRAEPTGFSHRIEQPLPKTPSHRVLMQVAIGDHQVTTLGAHVMARSIGAQSVKPAMRPIFGVPEVTPPHEGSTIVEYDFGLPPEPITNVPMREGEDPHGKVKNVPASAQQVDKFLRTGITDWFCSDTCNPD
jgi:hypothetical protein